MEGDTSKEKIPLQDITTYDDQLFSPSEAEHSSQNSSSRCNCSPFSKRYIISILALLGFCNVYALRVNLSVALVAMVSKSSTLNKEGKTVEEPAEFNWSSETQGIVLSSFFYGYIVTQLPGGYLALKFGGKNLFGLGILSTAVFTLLTPVAARAGVAVLVALRILIGLCEGIVFPANHAVWTKWAPPLERSKLTTIAVSGAHVGTVIAMPLSGVLAERLGWASVFYVFGSMGVAWAIVWFLVVRNSPAEDSNISEEERLFIESSLANDVQKKDVQVPWKAIFTSLPVWAIVVAHFSENWGFYTLLTELPSFLKHRLDFDLSKAGFVSALPYLVMAITIQTGGHIADCLRRKQVLTTTVVRKLFNSFGFVCQGVCIVIAGYTNNWLVAVVCLTLAVGGGGFAFSGFFVNHLDIAPQFGGILMGISNTVATLPGIVSPLLTGVIVQHQSSAGEWRIVFYLGGLIYIIGAILYCIFASGNKQTWAAGYSELTQTDDDEEDVES
ncbi:hypothetical protein ACROYT_G029714 [Oculina patagonica]